MANSAKKIVAASIGLALGVCSYSANAMYVIGETGSVSDIVTQTGSASWIYQLSISNPINPQYIGQASVVSLVVPYFSDAGISNITDPSNWTHSIIAVTPTSDLLTQAYPKVTQELVWSTTGAGVTPGQSLSGFGFTASYGPVKGPYLLGESYYQRPLSKLIDPPIPGSPNTIAAGFTQSLAPIPEPETYSLMLAGLGLLGFMARRRKVA